jgi:hypothetical protein
VTLSAPEAQTQAALLGLGIAQVGVHHALVHLQSGALKTVLVGQHDPGITRWLSSILTVRWSRHA